jgi:hypothetical protein
MAAPAPMRPDDLQYADSPASPLGKRAKLTLRDRCYGDAAYGNLTILCSEYQTLIVDDN